MTKIYAHLTRVFLKVIRTIVIIISSIYVLSSCRQSSELTASEKREISEEVQTMLGHYFEDINKEGLLSEFRYLDNSPDFFWVPPGYSTSISYDSVAVILKATAPALRSIDYKWETLRIIPLSAELATFTQIIQGVFTDTNRNVDKIKAHRNRDGHQASKRLETPQRPDGNFAGIADGKHKSEAQSFPS